MKNSQVPFVLYINFKNRFLHKLVAIILLVAACAVTHAQEAATQLNIPYKDKPKEYQSKKLPAEKTGEGKLRGVKSFTQNLFTHYNFVFNAQQRLIKEENVAIKQAFSSVNLDKQLPFYPEEFGNISHSQYLDTVIQKATAALLLHDLRNKWNDEVYLLFGKAYYYKHNLDTAIFNFEFLNYAYAPKDEGFDLPLASNRTYKEGHWLIMNQSEKAWKHQPSRNEGILWLARTLASNKQLDSAHGLLELVQLESAFPKNQLNNLHQTKAFVFYQQHQPDSAATYLSKFEPKGSTLKAWYYYLTAQLWQQADSSNKAQYFFGKAAYATNDAKWQAYAIIHKYLAILNGNFTSEEKEKAKKKLAQIIKKEKLGAYKQLAAFKMAEYYASVGDTEKSLFYIDIAKKASSFDNNTHNAIFYKLAHLDADNYRFKTMVQDYDSINLPFSSSNQEFNSSVEKQKQAAAYIKKI